MSLISFITSICIAQGSVPFSLSATVQTKPFEQAHALENKLDNLPAQNAGEPAPAEAHASALVSAGPQLKPFLSSQVDRLSDIQWLLVLSLVSTSGVISWGVSHYVRHQTWQRIEFLRRAVKEFEQDPEIRNALKILDFEEYRDYYIPGGPGLAGAAKSSDPASALSAATASMPGQETASAIRFRMSDQLLCNALANHDQRAQTKSRLDYHQDHDEVDPAALRQYQIETALRDWFNKLLNGLEHFGYFIESGMFTEKELQPWLNYWIKLIGDPAYRRPGASKVYDALYSYVHHSGFFGVQKLFERFGYRILPSPYLDIDLLNLGLAERPAPSAAVSKPPTQKPDPKTVTKSPFEPANAAALASSDRSTPGYSTRLALTLAKASYLAYQDKQFVAEVVRRWGSAYWDAQQSGNARTQHIKNNIIRQNFRYFNNRGRDTQAYLFRTDEFMVLAFRGSQEPQDWTTNFTTQLRNFTVRKDGVTGVSSYKGRVHTGFFLAWAIIEKSVLAQMQRWRKDLAKEGKTLPPLYITGHSLGGALATMAAAALVDHNIAVAGVYTFGQPRVGDRTFVSQLNQNTGGRVYRFVNNNDIVPHVPPPFSIWNPTRLYGHVGTAKYFDSKGVIIANYKFATRFADYTIGLLKGISGSGFDLITDHNMEYYISHLDNALKEELEDKVAHRLEMGDAL
ncbi:MAG: lipase family protein [Cyanobacteria bacterium J06598_3]